MDILRTHWGIKIVIWILDDLGWCSLVMGLAHSICKLSSSCLRIKLTRLQQMRLYVKTGYDQNPLVGHNFTHWMAIQLWYPMFRWGQMVWSRIYGNPWIETWKWWGRPQQSDVFFSRMFDVHMDVYAWKHIVFGIKVIINESKVARYVLCLPTHIHTCIYIYNTHTIICTYDHEHNICIGFCCEIWVYYGFGEACLISSNSGSTGSLFLAVGAQEIQALHDDASRGGSLGP